MGCNCDSGGLGYAYSTGRAYDLSGGLGQIDPASMALAVADAKHLWDDFIKALGIGAGRREADVIVPVQNRAVSQTIAPIVDYLTQVREGKIEPDCNTVKTDQANLAAAEKVWLDFLHNTKWQDGRAAKQAEETLAPYWSGAKNDLAALATDACSITGSIGDIPILGNLLTTPGGGVNWPVVAIGGGLLYMFMKRK